MHDMALFWGGKKILADRKVILSLPQRKKWGFFCTYIMPVTVGKLGKWNLNALFHQLPTPSNYTQLPRACFLPVEFLSAECIQVSPYKIPSCNMCMWL
jgi:hypothetical protein